MAQAQLIERILRDVAEGVMVVDRQGVVLHLNPGGAALLGLPADAVGRPYAELLMQDTASGANDDFHQFLLDAVYDKTHTHSGEVTYLHPDGQTRILRVTTSFLRDDHADGLEGVILHFSDITELAALRRREREASLVAAGTILLACSWVFIVLLWQQLGRPVPAHQLTFWAEVYGVVMVAFLLRHTSFTWRDMGLAPRDLPRVLRVDGLIALGGLVLLVLIKLALLRLRPGFFPAGAPFWNWRAISLRGWLYPFTVVAQEWLTRGALHENLRRTFAGPHREAMAIVTSSMVFGVLHIQLGLVYMGGAVLLLGLLGVLYCRQNTIWGLCLPHYVLGMALTFLGFA